MVALLLQSSFVRSVKSSLKACFCKPVLEFYCPRPCANVCVCVCVCVRARVFVTQRERERERERER